MLRGVAVESPPHWTRGSTPPVVYTGRPLEPALPQRMSSHALRKRHRADVRLRRALVDAWCDPARARRDIHAASDAYASVGDAQGLANAFAAHAQTRIADAYLAEWGQQLSLPASSMAQEEYVQAHALYTTLLETSATHYETARQKPVHKAAVAQRMRPYPLNLDAEDACAAVLGVGAA
jgi:hypothetical protein